MNQKQQLIYKPDLTDLNDDFDTLLESIPDLKLPSYLTNFAEFQKLETAFAIKALYNISAQHTPKKLIVIENIRILIMRFITFKNDPITAESYQYINNLNAEITELTGEKTLPISIFIKKTNEFLFTSPFPIDIKIKIEKLFGIIQEASTLYYENCPTLKKTIFKNYATSISSYWLKHINETLQSVIKNPDSRDYLSNLNFILDKLKKTLEVKGVIMLLGEKTVDALKEQQASILSLQKTEQFLTHDFSKPIPKNQENSILAPLQVFSEMDINLPLEKTFRDIIKYYSQINIILGNKHPPHLIKKVNGYYKKIKNTLSSYAKDFEFKDKSQNSILLAIFGLMFLDPEAYYIRQETHPLFESHIKKICEESNSYLYEYFCFHIEVLNYIVFFQDKIFQGKEFKESSEKLKALCEKMTDIKKINDPCVTYLIKETAKNLLEGFSKKAFIPKLHSVNLENEFSIEQLSLLAKETRGTLSYLMEIKNFYNAFFSTMKHFSPGVLQKSKSLQEFEEAIELQKDQAEKQIDDIEKILEKKLTPLIAETIKVIIPYFRLNARGCFETRAGDYVQKHSYQAKLTALCNALTENFPKIDLTDPQNWENLLQKVFISNEILPVTRVLIFIVSAFYAEKGEYETALKFYLYSLEKKFFQISTKKDEEGYLITQKLIEDSISTCKKMLDRKNTPKRPDNLRVVVPRVFEQDPQASKSPLNEPIDEEIDLEIRPPLTGSQIS